MVAMVVMVMEKLKEILKGFCTQSTCMYSIQSVCNIILLNVLEIFVDVLDCTKWCMRIQ